MTPAHTTTDPHREFEREALPHTASLLRTALRYTRDAAAAEDLAQATLLHAWRTFDRYRPGSNCRAWLYRILLNCARTRWRGQRRTPIDPSADAVGASELHSLRQHRSEPTRAAEVHRVLGTLSEDHRIVLLLAVVEGFTCREISEILDLPIGTVMSRLSRARHRFREAVDGAAGR